MRTSRDTWFSGAEAGFIPSTYAAPLDGDTRLLLWGMGIEDVAPSGDALFRRRAARKGITFVDAAERVERALA